MSTNNEKRLVSVGGVIFDASQVMIVCRLQSNGRTIIEFDNGEWVQTDASVEEVQRVLGVVGTGEAREVVRK